MKRPSPPWRFPTLDPRLRRLGPFLALALAVLPAAWPYFAAGVPRTNDVFHHLYRTVALDRMVRAGSLWPRWSPDLVAGHGYPVFSFFPSLSHLGVELLHLAGLELTTAYRVAVVTHFALAAWFAYSLARDLFGSAGGWVGAVAYAYSPYLLYDAHVRGSLPETLALALLPLLFLALRWAIQRDGRWVVVCGLTFAALILSHPAVTFQLAVPVGLFLVWLGWSEGWRDLWKPVAGLVLGGLAAAFYWLPMFAEIQYVQSGEAVARGFNYRDYFLTLRQMLSWPRLPVDPALVNPPVVRSLPQVTLALAALLLLWRWRRLSHAVRRQVGLWGALLALGVVLASPLSRPLWDHFPPLQLTLTPFRYLGMPRLAVGPFLAVALPLTFTASPATGSVLGPFRVSFTPVRLPAATAAALLPVSAASAVVVGTISPAPRANTPVVAITVRRIATSPVCVDVGGCPLQPRSLQYRQP